VDLARQLAETIMKLASERARVLVAVDGPDAAGKTILADALAERLPGAVRASIDHFENLREVRYRDGVESGESYYDNGFDHRSLRERLLMPFAAGDSPVLTHLRESSSDDLVEVFTDVPDHAVLIVDGCFLQRPELRALWSLVVYLSVSPEMSLDRARVRDLAWTDSVTEVESGYLGRYLPGQAVYRQRVDPERLADVLVDNTDPASPAVLRQPRL
jgi:uridine kinase